MAGKSKENPSNFDLLGVVQPLLREPRKPTGKTARTMMLNHRKFEEFQEACRIRGAKPSDLIGQWIESFLIQIKEQKTR
jgi:hypothetical protein